MEKITLYKQVNSAYKAMLEACRQAKNEIIFEQYIFDDYYPEGAAGEFLTVFLQKAREGLKVVLHIDAAGSLRFFTDGNLQKTLKDAGIELHFYRRLPFKMLVNIERFILRNHSKLMIIDQKQVWIGGVVVGDDYRQWNDLMVCYDDHEIAYKTHEHFFDQLSRYQGNKEFKFSPIQLTEETELLCNSPGFTKRFISKQIHQRIEGAKKSIKIITPYFAPTPPTWIELKNAARRGVEVTIVLPQDTDYNFINYINRGYFKKFIKDKINVYLMPNMVHAKLVMVDDEWVTFGSTNFDTLSLIYNHELNFATTNQTTIHKLAKYFQSYLSFEHKLNKNDLKFRLSTAIKIQLCRLLRFIA